MRTKVHRFTSDNDATLSGLFLEKADGPDEFLCFGLEDEYRTQKVWGETRIPSGVYKVGLRKEGGFHNRYKKRFPSMHQGMLHIQDVPGFEYVLIHIGNDDDDTAGCLLVGLGADRDQMMISNSLKAYVLVYQRLLPAALANDLTIEFIDQDRAQVWQVLA